MNFGTRMNTFFRVRLEDVHETECESVQLALSAFIDSMATSEECETVESHVAVCEACRRQLQSYVSVRSLLHRAHEPEVPEDLALDVRVRLSRERNPNHWERLETRLANMIKPLAIPAVSGIMLTVLGFGAILGGLLPGSTVMANVPRSDTPMSNLYNPVRTTDPTMMRFAVSDNRSLDEPLMIETDIDPNGKVFDFRIISGPQTPEINRWVKELLYFADFQPATAFGRPVDSKIILSFVAVRS